MPVLRQGILTKQSPSYQSHARNAEQSAYPGLWRDLAAAFPTSFGQTGARLVDATGNGNNGDLLGGLDATSWQRFKGRNCILFDDATADRVIIPRRVLTKTTEFTFSMWYEVAFNQSLAQMLSQTYDSGNHIEHSCQFSDSYRSMDHDNFSPSGGVIRSGADSLPLVDTNWHHGVWSRSGGNLQWWFDGSLIAEDTPDTYTGTVPTETVIGSYSTSSGCTVRMADVYLYNRGLNPNEIRQLYRDPIAPFRRSVSVPAFVAGAPPVGGDVISRFYYDHLLSGVSI